MGYLTLSKRVWAAGLLVICLLGWTGETSAAGPYDNLKWRFSVPVKLKNIMTFFKKYDLRVKVFGPDGQIGEGESQGLPIGPEGSVDSSTLVIVKVFPGKDPFKANRYTVDFQFSHTGGPNLCNDPGFEQNIPAECRALPGSQLVSHIDQPMPSPYANGPDVNTAGVLVQQ